MEYIMIILLLVVIMSAFFMGNTMIIVAIFDDYPIDWSEDWFGILVAIVADIILLCLVCKKIMPPVSSSFQLMRSGLKNRRSTKKESKKLKKLLKNEKLDLNRLQELRDKRISEEATKRTFHFCRLMETISGKGQLQDCLSKVREKQNVLDEIHDIENRILKIAEGCKNAGDVEKCKYYLNILKSTKITPEIASLEKECEERRFLRKKERNAIWLWKTVFLGILILLIGVFASLYTADTPYRELRSMIKDQSLTSEMCSRENRNSEDSYYNYLISEKGCKIVASELTQLHRADDVGKAMWLLCIQPISTVGYHMWASPSFITWIVGYAKNNGVRSTDRRGPDDTWYNVTYKVDGYKITMDSYDDKKSNIGEISDFTISDGENRITVENRSRNSNATPAIE